VRALCAVHGAALPHAELNCRAKTRAWTGPVHAIHIRTLKRWAEPGKTGVGSITGHAIVGPDRKLDRHARDICNQYATCSYWAEVVARLYYRIAN
jgi:hypothetical protein